MSWTGTLTRPKLSDPLQSVRGTSGRLLPDARLERRQQVVAVVGLLLGGQIDLLARRLALDQGQHRLPVGVLEIPGVEVLLKRADQLLRHLALAVRRLAASPLELELVAVDHLIVEAQRV